MTPESFSTMYEAATETPPPTNLAPSAVKAGRRRLVRRRLAVTGAGLAALAVVAGSAYAGTGLTEDSPDTQVATPGATADDQIIERCRTLDGNSEEAVDAVYSVGHPTIVARAETPDQTTYVLMAADEKVWAECSLPRSGQTSPTLTYFFPPGPITSSGVRHFLAPGSSLRTAAAVGSGCALVEDSPDPGCRTFVVRVTDRLPAAVASVAFRTGDGKTTVVDRQASGFVLLDHVGELPDGVPADPSEWGEFRALERVTYLDADGDPIAAGAMDGSGDPMKDERVAGLRSLEKYLSLKSNPEPGLIDEVR
ncbi:hypothetical protein [Nocardioides speluncae]|uniref:hypothetical protein n=1 Tax=Nocardioides speluncae TaxID=2670337 RepID=UPI0012B1685B|nr:hypothetical protein [Nocardioides speluncae]